MQYSKMAILDVTNPSSMKRECYNITGCWCGGSGLAFGDEGPGSKPAFTVDFSIKVNNEQKFPPNNLTTVESKRQEPQDFIQK